MKTIEEIINDYTAGKVGLEDTNKALKEAGSGLTLNPGRNVITEEELRATTVGDTPEEANGWGLMDHGVGSHEKVHVVDGRTVDVDMGAEVAFVYIGGKKYELKGDKLVDPED